MEDIVPSFVHSFKGSVKEEIHKEAADKILRLAKQLKLEVDVEVLIESHKTEL
jgi:hypothetical protein